MSIATIPRRIVTGLRDGRSVIISDAVSDNVSEHIPGLIMSDIWATDSMPVDLHRTLVPENTLFPQTPANGTYFRYVQILPDELLETPPQAGQPHPLMHQTNTLDYVVILSGEVWLVMEEGETLVRAGDIVIQRGTNHAWSNRSGQPCIQLAVLVAAK
ncbi:cupin domain-containing protein [Chitinophaga vietnamensis]|uniref:cupin domain-containing protein n=1 Tax=Chitinophaga vietnamensis TaxID=2593957 RepID=UPI001178455B|nr:cupin domain-containing protein [Chitinophaga vietnamensis]